MNTLIPTKLVGPIKIISSGCRHEIKVPLATFETPLWFSVSRGGRVANRAEGIQVTLVQESMTRSILMEAEDAASALSVINSLDTCRETMEQLVIESSRFTKLVAWHTQIVGSLIYLRFSFTTGEAAGHNMSTKAAEVLQQWLLNRYPELKYLSISGNYCVDKKNSSVNGILGRGKYVIAEAVIPRDTCYAYLHTYPENIVDLNIKKNLLGSIISGGVRTANAHFANMLLAFYLATGQDAANIVEGSQGFTYAEVRDGALYFSVTLPNIIVGAVGSGKKLASIEANLADLFNSMGNDILETKSRQLAVAAAAVVWCGELSLLAAQCTPGALMRSHIALER